MGGECIRYSEAFKLEIVRALATGKLSSVEEARRRYGIAGADTVRRWIQRYGTSQQQTKVVRVEKPDERDRIKALEARIRELERAVADSKVEELLARAYFHVVCEQFGVEDEEALKKNIAQKLSDGRLTTAPKPREKA
jgi:transposase-like protein